jgi:Cof subfamily protein (haloacid dehalogenase superfamily)
MTGTVHRPLELTDPPGMAGVTVIDMEAKVRSSRFLAIDIDGTLCSRGLPPTQRSIDAMAKLRSSGWGVVLCTGRRWDRTGPIVRAAGLVGPHVIEDGATIVNDSGDAWRRKLIPPSAALRLMEASAHHSVTLILGGEDMLATTTPNEDVRFMMSYGDPEPSYFGDHLAEYATERPISLAYLLDGANSDGFAALLRQLESDDDLAVRRSVPGMASVVASGVSKGAAMEHVLEGSDQNRVLVAIGDGQNDIPLFSMATFSFAMGGSNEDVRRSATYVTETIENEGAARAMEHLLAIG